MMQLLSGNRLMQKGAKKRFKIIKKQATILFEFDPEAHTLGAWLADRPGAE